jgi:small subunit ribosomal protein S7
MSRSKHIVKRTILPDEKYNSVTVAKFINILMSEGKRAVARRVLYTALDNIKQKMNTEPLEIFQRALDNVRPLVEVKSRRVGGATYQVPVEVTEDRGAALAMRWITMFARKRTDKTMASKLSAELMDAANKAGSAFKKKDDTHKMAEANRAFSHFRW